jgi:hypothetical protein
VRHLSPGDRDDTLRAPLPAIGREVSIQLPKGDRARVGDHLHVLEIRLHAFARQRIEERLDLGIRWVRAAGAHKGHLRLTEVNPPFLQQIEDLNQLGRSRGVMAALVRDVGQPAAEDLDLAGPGNIGPGQQRTVMPVSDLMSRNVNVALLAHHINGPPLPAELGDQVDGVELDAMVGVGIQEPIERMQFG